jgi:uncharacterized RDD family membrane protein YckC
VSFDQSIITRAGFWRRYLAFLIDMIVVGLPFQIIAAILFPATSGWIQGTGILTFSICENVQKVPDTLSPAGANFARQCRHFFFGLETARSLVVSRVTKEGLTGTTVSQTYMLDREGQLINGVSIGLLVPAALVAYLTAFETRRGATPGSRVTRIRVVDMADLEATGVRFRKIIARYLAMLIGVVVKYRAGSGRAAPTRRMTLGSTNKMTPDQARTLAKKTLGAVAHGADPATQ